MATRAEKPSQPTDSVAQAAEDLATIFPESEVTIAGETITFTEYPFVQWIQVIKPQHKDFIDALAELVSTSGEGLLIDDLVEFFEDHFADVSKLLTISTTKSAEWLATLHDDDMQQIIMYWWGLNKHFFLKSVSRILRKQEKLSAGQTSSNP